MVFWVALQRGVLRVARGWGLPGEGLGGGTPPNERVVSEANSF